MRTSLNIERLESVAKGLGDRLAETAFVGGAVVELYVDDPAAPPVRNTADIDCVVSVTDRQGMRQWEEVLRGRGFRHDLQQGAPICRWIYDGTIVDVMPADGDVLGFTNPWYGPGLENTIWYRLPSGTEIRIFALPWYVGTKMVAAKGRGGNDLRWSHDFEDVIYLWDCIPDFVDRLMRASADLVVWIAKEMKEWRQRPELREAVECVVEQGSPHRVRRILSELEELAG
ncbi:MAG: hypothetical protein IPK50_03660 [Fibrobacterota bacterium]|nr:MAG: hypothetical protein IPK50_03660 [Fibrobacterota bacterium]